MFLRLATRVTSIVLITSFMFSQLAWASMYDSWLNTDNQTTEEMQQEGFIGEEYIDTLQDMSKFQEEKVKEINEFTSTLDSSQKGIFESIENTLARTKEANEITSYMQGKDVADLQNMSSQMAALIQSYDMHYVLYKNGKKVVIDKGQVASIENETYYDKHGNPFTRDTNWMSYNDDNKLTYYESTTVDSFGNITDVKWEDAVYYTADDESLNPRNKSGELSSFKETAVTKTPDPDGYTIETTVTNWTNISYYTDDDEGLDTGNIAGKMASYSKTISSNVTPDKVDTITTSNIKYLKRDKVINELAYDSTFEEETMRDDDYYEYLITSFDESRESLGVTTDRTWTNALYNDYNEVVYYEESSTTLGVGTERIFSDAIYYTAADELLDPRNKSGKISSFKDVSITHGIVRDQTRSNMQYNNLNQLISYNDLIIEDGVTTNFSVDSMTYNSNGQVSSMHQVIETSEGFHRNLVKSEMIYDTKGLITHYREIYAKEGITYNLERSNIVHNVNGFLISYDDVLSENGSYTDFDGEVVNINKTSSASRTATTYDGNGNISSYSETRTDETGKVIATERTNILYSNGNVVSYTEEQNISSEFTQSSLSVNELDELILTEGEYVLTDETITLNYTLTKTFSGALYSGKKITAYTETTEDTRKLGVPVTTSRTNQTYNEKGQIVSYTESISVLKDGITTTESREWKDGAYDALGNIAGYSETLTNASGGVTFLSWEAKKYNPLNLVESYQQVDIVDGVITTTIRNNIKYDALGRMMSYEESFQDGQKLPEETTWEALGYNMSGMLTGYKEITTTGSLSKENIRNYITYNLDGRIIRYVESLHETGSYTDLSGTEIIIDRLSKVERIDTVFNDSEQLESYIQNEYTPEGFTHKINKKQITYSPEGNITAYIETREISGEGKQNDISIFDYAIGIDVSATNDIVMEYTTKKTFENGVYDELNRMTGYRETLKDTRKGEESTVVERSNQVYGDGGNIVAYNELMTVTRGSDVYANDTSWTGSYDGSGRLKNYNTTSLDSENITREKNWEAADFNVLNLMIGYKETNIIKDGETELLRNSTTRNNICYDDFNRVRAYTETNTNARDYATEKIWMGSYGDLGLLSNDVVQVVDNGLVTNVVSFYEYNADGNVSGKISSQEEFLKEGFTLNQYTNANTKFFDLLTASALIYPADVSYHKVTYNHRTAAVYDTYGRVIGSTDINYDAYGNTVTTIKTGVTYNNTNLETGYTQEMVYDYTANIVNPAGLNYTVNKIYTAFSFDKIGMASETTEVVRDSRKPDVTTTITNTGLSYNDLGLVSHYEESIADSYFNAELNDSIVDMKNTVRDIVYADSGKMSSYDETVSTKNDTGTYHLVPQTTTETFTDILGDLSLTLGGTIDYIPGVGGDILLNDTESESYGWLCGMMPNYDLSEKRYLNLKFQASSVGEFKIELKNTDDQIITDTRIVIPVVDTVGEEITYTVDLNEYGLKPNTTLNFMAITDPKGNNISIAEFDFNEFSRLSEENLPNVSAKKYEESSYIRSYNCNYNDGWMVNEYNETVTKDGKTTHTSADNIAYDSFGNQIFSYSKVTDQYGKNNYSVSSYNYIDGFMNASVETTNSDYSSALYSVNTRNNIVYDTKGNIKSYNDSYATTGEYYNSYDVDGAGVGNKVIVDAIRTSNRTDTTYNNFNQVASFIQENVDESGLKTERTRTDIAYTVSDHVKSYNDVIVSSDSTGVNSYTYTNTVAYTASAFDDKGQPSVTEEITTDSRKPLLNTIITKTFTYNTDGLVDSLHENISERRNDEANIYRNNSVKVRTGIVYTDGLMTSYKEEGNSSLSAAFLGTVWTKSTYDASYNALNGMISSETLVIEQSSNDSIVVSVNQSITSDITYDSKMRKNGYTTTSISGFGNPEAVIRTVTTENITYDSFGREVGFTTKENNGGVLTTTVRDNVAYTQDDGSGNYFGKLDSYREIKTVTGNLDIAAVADINSVSVSYRENTSYNEYGWVTSTTDRIYETVNSSLFDWVNIESPLGTKESVVIRNNTGFTTSGEVIAYGETISVLEKNNPSGLSWIETISHDTNGFNMIGQEVSYTETRTDSRTPLITTTIERENITYDSASQLKGYSETITEGSSDFGSPYYMETQTVRSDTAYDNLGRITGYTESRTETVDTGEVNTLSAPSEYTFTDILDGLILNGSSDISCVTDAGGDITFSTSNGWIGSMMPNYDLSVRNVINMRVTTSGPSRFYLEIKNTTNEVVTGDGKWIELPDTGGQEETVSINLSDLISPDIVDTTLNYMAFLNPVGDFTITEFDFNEFDRVEQENLEPLYAAVYDKTVSDITYSGSYHGETMLLSRGVETTLVKDLSDNELSSTVMTKSNIVYGINARESAYTQIQQLGVKTVDEVTTQEVTTQIEFENITYDLMGMQSGYIEKDVNDYVIVSREKSNIKYTIDEGSNTAYGLINSYDEITRTVNAGGSALIADSVSKTNRISTSYDEYGRTVGYTEQSYGAVVSDETDYRNTVFPLGIQKSDTTRSGITYSRTGQVVSYSENSVVSAKDIDDSSYILKREYEVGSFDLAGNVISLKETVTDTRTSQKITEVVKSSQSYNEAGLIDSFVEIVTEKDIDAKDLNNVVQTIRSSTTYDYLGRMVSYNEKTTNTIDTLNLDIKDALPPNVIDGAAWNEDASGGKLTYNSDNGLLDFNDAVGFYIWGDLASREDLALNPVVNLKVRTNGEEGQSASVYLEVINTEWVSITDIPETEKIEKIEFDIPDTEGKWKIISVDTTDLQVAANGVVAITCFSDPSGAPIDVESLFFSDTEFEVYQNITESYITESNWTGNYYGTSSVLADFSENITVRDIADNILKESVSEKTDIIYDSKMQEAGYKLLDYTDKDIDLTETVFSDIKYDALGRQSSYQMGSVANGIEYTTLRETMLYDNNHNLISYVDTIYETSIEGSEVEIDKVSKVEREATSYNGLGQVISYTQTAYDPKISDVNDWKNTVFANTDLKTITTRSNIDYTKYGQMTRYKDSVNVKGTETQIQTVLSYDSDGEPVETQEDVICELNYIKVNTYEVLEYDSMGRALETFETSRDERRLNITTETKKVLSGYDELGRVTGYFQLMKEKERYTGVIRSATSTDRHDIVYVGNTDIVLSYSDDYAKFYPADSPNLKIPRSMWHRDFVGECYTYANGTAIDYYKTTTETTTKKFLTIEEVDGKKVVLSEDTIKTTNIRTGSANDVNYVGIGYDSLGRIVSYSDTSSSENLIDGLNDMGTVTECWNQTYNSLGLSASYEQASGYAGIPESMDHTVWCNAVYDQFGRNTSSYQIITDVGGIKTYSSYNNAAFDSYGRLISYDKNDVEYLEFIDAENMTQGMNRNTITTWNALVFDDEDRSVKSLSIVETKQGAINTFKTIEAESFYDNSTGDIEQSKEIEKTLDIATKQLLLRTDTLITDIDYDGLGRKKGYTSVIKKGMNDNENNVVMEERSRDDIAYDEYGRVIAYLDNIAKENYLDRYTTVVRTDTQYADYTENGAGQIASYIEYEAKIKPDENLSSDAKMTAVSAEVVTLFGENFVNASLVDNDNFYTTQTIVTFDYLSSGMMDSQETKEINYRSDGISEGYKEENTKNIFSYNADGNVAAKKYTLVERTAETEAGLINEDYKTIMESNKTNITYNTIGLESTWNDIQTDIFGNNKEILRTKTNYNRIGKEEFYIQDISETITVELPLSEGLLLGENATDISNAGIDTGVIDTLSGTGERYITIKKTTQEILQEAFYDVDTNLQTYSWIKKDIDNEGTITGNINDPVVYDKLIQLGFNPKVDYVEPSLTNGEKIINREEFIDIYSEISFDAAGNLTSSETTTKSSNEPNLTLIDTKENLLYDEYGRENGYFLNYRKTGLDYYKNALDYQDYTTRLNTIYDLFDNVIGFNESRHNTVANREMLVNRTGIEYDSVNNVVGYSETAASADGEYTSLTVVSDTEYDQNGRRTNYKQLFSETDIPNNISRSTITDRTNTGIDALGNTFFYVERNLDVNSAISEEDFINGTVMVEGKVTDTVYQGGRYVETGEYDGFLKTTKIKDDVTLNYDNTAVAGNDYDEVIATHRYGQVRDLVGDNRDYYETEISSKTPKLITERTVTDSVPYITGGRDRETISETVYSIVDDGENFWQKTVTNKTDIRSDEYNGKPKSSITKQNFYLNKDETNPTKITEINELFLSYTHLDSPEEVTRIVKTTTKGAGNTDVVTLTKVDTKYFYDENLNVLEEHNDEYIYANQIIYNETLEPSSHKNTVTSTIYDTANRISAQTVTTIYTTDNAERIVAGYMPLKTVQDKWYTYTDNEKLYDEIVYNTKIKNNIDDSLVKITEKAETNVIYNELGYKLSYDTVYKEGESDGVLKDIYTNYVDITSLDAKGRAAYESITGTNYIYSEGVVTTASFTENRSDIKYDADSQRESYILNRTDEGKPDTVNLLSVTKYDGLGRIAFDSKKDDLGVITEKRDIFYIGDREFSFIKEIIKPAGSTEVTERINTVYDDALNIISTVENVYKTKDGEQGIVYERTTDNIIYDVDNRIESRDVVDRLTVVVDQTTMQTVILYEDLKSEIITYDNYGRMATTVTDITQPDGLTRNQTYEVISRDAANGNITESLITVIDDKNRTLLNHEFNILYNPNNQKISYEIESTDKYGNAYHKNRYDITYDGNLMLSGYKETDFEDSYKPAQGITTLSDTTYDANGQQSGFIRSGTDYMGNDYHEIRVNMVYDTLGRLSGYTSSGDNKGVNYNYDKSAISYAEEDGTNIEKGEISGYIEVGNNSKYGGYTATHSLMQYDSKGRLLSEREEGTRRGVVYGDDKTFTYFEEGHAWEGELKESVSDSFVNDDIVTRVDLVYDDEGRLISEREYGIREDKAFDNDIVKTYYTDAETAPGTGNENQAGEIKSITTTSRIYFYTWPDESTQNDPNDTIEIADYIIRENIIYDDFGRVISEINRGQQEGKNFNNFITRTYYLEGQFKGKESNLYTYDKLTNPPTGDCSHKLYIEYDQNGNMSKFLANTVKGGKSSLIWNTLTYKIVNDHIVLATKYESGTSDGTLILRKQENFDYDAEGKTISYLEREVDANLAIKADGYTRNVTSMVYNPDDTLAQMIYTDTRNTNFQSKSFWYAPSDRPEFAVQRNASYATPNQIAETYDYDYDINNIAAIASTTMVTPDYTAVFSADGTRTDPVESIDYKNWSEARKLELYRQNRGQKQQGILVEILNAGWENFSMPNGESAEARRLYYVAHPTDTDPRTQVARDVFHDRYLAGEAGYYTTINFEGMDKAKIYKVVEAMIKANFKDDAEAEELLSRYKKFIDDAAYDEEVVPLGNGEAGTKKVKKARKLVINFFRAKNVSVEEIKDILSDVLEEILNLEIETVEDLNNYGYDEVFEAIMGGSISFYAYDAAGQLVWGFELAAYKMDDGTRYTKVSRTEQVDGQLVTTMRETFNGPSGKYVVDSVIDPSGIKTSHAYGTDALGQQLDETRVSRTEEVDGGFKTIVQITDNLTGCKSKEVSTYTNITYHRGKMVEYDLTKVVTGTRWQNNRAEEIHMVTKIKQYDTKFDDKGRLVEYKQDIWKNSAPNKYTTVMYQNLAFNTKNQVIEQIITTHEWGKGTDGEGGSIILDATTTAHRSNIIYDVQGRVVSFTEYTYDPNGEVTTTSQNEIVYDYIGRMVSYRNEDGDNASFSYDNMGLIKASEQFGEYSYDIVYDASGNKIQWFTETKQGDQVIEGVNHVEYNELGQQIKVYKHEYSHGDSFSMNEESYKTYTYDTLGNRTAISEQIYEDTMESTKGGYGSMLATVAAIACAATGVLAGVAALIVAGARFAGGLADGESFGESFKAAIIAGVATYVGGKLAEWGLGTVAADASLKAVAMASFKEFAVRTAINTGVNMLRGQDFEHAVVNGAIQAAAAIAAESITDSLAGQEGDILFGHDITANAISGLASGTLTGMAQGADFEDALEGSLIVVIGQVAAANVKNMLNPTATEVKNIGKESASLSGQATGLSSQAGGETNTGTPVNPDPMKQRDNEMQRYYKDTLRNAAISEVTMQLSEYMGDREAQFISTLVTSMFVDSLTRATNDSKATFISSFGDAVTNVLHTEGFQDALQIYVGQQTASLLPDDTFMQGVVESFATTMMEDFYLGAYIDAKQMEKEGKTPIISNGVVAQKILNDKGNYTGTVILDETNMAKAQAAGLLASPEQQQNVAAGFNMSASTLSSVLTTLDNPNISQVIVNNNQIINVVVTGYEPVLKTGKDVSTSPMALQMKTNADGTVSLKNNKGDDIVLKNLDGVAFTSEQLKTMFASQVPSVLGFETTKVVIDAGRVIGVFMENSTSGKSVFVSNKIDATNNIKPVPIENPSNNFIRTKDISEGQQISDATLLDLQGNLFFALGVDEVLSKKGDEFSVNNTVTGFTYDFDSAGKISSLSAAALGGEGTIIMNFVNGVVSGMQLRLDDDTLTSLKYQDGQYVLPDNDAALNADIERLFNANIPNPETGMAFASRDDLMSHLLSESIKMHAVAPFASSVESLKNIATYGTKMKNPIDMYIQQEIAIQNHQKSLGFDENHKYYFGRRKQENNIEGALYLTKSIGAGTFTLRVQTGSEPISLKSQEDTPFSYIGSGNKYQTNEAQLTTYKTILMDTDLDSTFIPTYQREVAFTSNDKGETIVQIFDIETVTTPLGEKTIYKGGSLNIGFNDLKTISSDIGPKTNAQDILKSMADKCDASAFLGAGSSNIVSAILEKGDYSVANNTDFTSLHKRDGYTNRYIPLVNGSVDLGPALVTTYDMGANHYEIKANFETWKLLEDDSEGGDPLDTGTGGDSENEDPDEDIREFVARMYTAIQENQNNILIPSPGPAVQQLQSYLNAINYDKMDVMENMVLAGINVN